MRGETRTPARLSRAEVLRQAPFPFHVLDSVEALHARFVNEVMQELQAARHDGRHLRIALPVGPFDYAALADSCNQAQVSWQHATVYPIDEFCLPNGQVVPREHPWSLRGHIDQALFERLNSAFTVPPAQRRYLAPATVAAIAAELAADPLDLAFFGFGIDGHVAMNGPEPGLTVDKFRALGVRPVWLTPETITQLAMGGAGGDLEAVPKQGLTLGMREILGARALRVYLMRTWQPAGMRRACFGPVTAAFPGSLIQTHPNVQVSMVSYVADPPWHETTQRP